MIIKQGDVELAQIYDFLSRQPLSKLKQHNNEQSDKIIEQHGKYIGVLTKQRTESLRQIIDLLELKKNQIEQLMSEFEELQSGYDEMVIEAVNFLEAKKNGVDFDPETWDFYVDVKGHCWVVKNSSKV
ncbi:hypothetical protein J27TS7_16280 [Paenibacillus dendritiformis]|uniref:hypothetical protein n=1 Tax=Paenibacillus dendritiformis TaxID=130049 RepID=UPI001B1E3E60|nr:hypothetical protein [Paenibacillus dendritiformis]GIO72114.1 hypothetical protein J27TS7_16280 [Paenibacillus dendritiformis]